MSLITFENLPSTNTPINAQNLNNNFDELNTGITNLQPVTLWTNSSPSSSFLSQQITLNDSLENYNYIEVVYRRSTNSTQYGVTGRIPKEYNFQINMPSNYFYWRNVTIDSNTKITITDCRYYTVYGQGSDSTQNNNVIPYKVLGYK